MSGIVTNGSLRKVWVAESHHDLIPQGIDRSGELTDDFGMKDLALGYGGDPSYPSSIVEIKWERPQTYNLITQFCFNWNDMLKQYMSNLAGRCGADLFQVAFVHPEIYNKTKSGCVNPWASCFPTRNLENPKTSTLRLRVSDALPPQRGNPPWPNFETHTDVTRSHVNYILTGNTSLTLIGTYYSKFEIELVIDGYCQILEGQSSTDRVYACVAKIKSLTAQYTGLRRLISPRAKSFKALCKFLR